MAAETLDETPNSIDTLLECLRILRKVEHELDTWRPTMERFKAPAAGYLAGRAARKAKP